MNRLLGPAAILAVLLVAAGATVTLVSRPAPTQAERADALARELRCPDCQGLSVADSPTQSAAEIRRQIDGMLASGASEEAVRQHFVERYGEWVLLAPRPPLFWALPFAAVALGVVGVVAWLRRSAPPGVDAEPPDPAARRRVHEEAEALDA